MPMSMCTYMQPPVLGRCEILYLSLQQLPTDNAERSGG